MVFYLITFTYFDGTPSSGVGWKVKQATHEIGFLPPDVTVKDLGLHRSMMLIPGEHFNKIKEKLMAKVGMLARKRLTAPAVRHMADAIVKASLCYGEKFLAVAQPRIDAIERPLKAAFKKAAGLACSLPNGILAGPRALGEM